MRHQIANGDVLLAVLREIWKVSGHRIGKADSALLYQLHYRGGCRDALGERGEIENSIDGHGLVRWFERPGAERLAVEDFAVVSNDQHCARDVVFRHCIFNHCIDRLEVSVVARLRRLRGQGRDRKAENQRKNYREEWPSKTSLHVTYYAPPDTDV